MAEEEAAAEEQTKKKKKYRRDKPWDDDTIDHWKIDPFTAEDNPFGGMSAFLNSGPDCRNLEQCSALSIIYRSMPPAQLSAYL